MKILVTGGAGYIGSIVCSHLLRLGHKVVVYDNLSTGNKWALKNTIFYKGDIRCYQSLYNVFVKEKPHAVFHFAAKAYVGDSVNWPIKYYDNNVTGTITLLNVMNACGCRKIIFSSTCSMYGEVQIGQKINENFNPKPMNPYAKTKWFVENLLHDSFNAYNISSFSLRYFNAAGAMMNCELGENHEPETHLIPNLIKAAISGDTVNIFGNNYPTRDGTCERDYIHVEDLASAHIKALNYITECHTNEFCNLGTGTGYTINEIITYVENTIGNKINVNLCEPRKGDPASLVADPGKALSLLGWSSQYNMNDIIKSAYSWELKLGQGKKI